MKERVPIEGFKKGLAPKNNPRNNPMLAESIGAHPFNGNLVSQPNIDSIDVSSLGKLSFPYPQIFVLADCIVVCTPTAIYEYASETLTLKISGLSTGFTWNILDFQKFLYLSNGVVSVTKSNGTYAVSSLPAANAMCVVGGRAIIDQSGVSNG